MKHNSEVKQCLDTIAYRLSLHDAKHAYKKNDVKP
jgi:hypothetical protein